MRDSGFSCTASQVLVTVGGKYAVFVAFAALCDPGDEVICPAPYWTTYPESILLAGGVPVVVDTTEKTECKVTVEQLEKARTAKTKVLLFVSPNNPSGSVYSPEETIAIGKWAVEHGIWVITDEIYEHLTCGKHKFSSMPTLLPELANQCVIVNGVAKTYAMTSWWVGWMIGPPDVMKAAINSQSHTTSNVSAVAQFAALEAVSGALIHKMLNAIPGVTCMEPQGAFYCFPNVRGLLGRNLSGASATNTLELADLVLEHAKVAFVPGEAFGAPGYACFSFALGNDDLKQGIEQFSAFVSG
jgi:aspartate/methionine/tyrosine aminotransferase